MFKISKKIQQLGLDIGSSHIKYVLLSGTIDSPSLVDFDSIKIDDGREATKKALADIAVKLSSITKEANTSISGPNVVVRYVELPKMTEDEMKSSMKFEAEKHIPFSLKEVEIDSEILEFISHGMMRVLLVAAKKETVALHAKLLEESGLSAKVVDCDAFALFNAFLFNYPDISKEANTVLLNIGEKITTMNILKGKIPYFTRELKLGGADFTQAIFEKMTMADKKTAEILRDDPKDKANDILDATRQVATNLVDEVRLSLNYFENQAGASVNDIYISGGLSSLNGLVASLSSALGIEIKTWDPMRRLRLDPKIDQEKLTRTKPLLPIALGLAIRG